MPSRLLLWGFKPPREVAASGLGRLERAVLERVWEQGEASVRDMQHRLGSEVAYTTLMTTLDRLYKKGLLQRRKSGRAFVYAAAVSREELESRVAADLFEGLLAQEDRSPLLSSLIDSVTRRDHRLLDELERLVREKRRALRQGR